MVLRFRIMARITEELPTSRLAALIPKPRVNLTRFHGVFSPNSKLRKKVVLAKPLQNKPSSDKPGIYGQTWAQRLKRVFSIDIEKCEKCGSKMKVISSIEDPDVIDKILKHLGLVQSSRLRSWRLQVHTLIRSFDEQDRPLPEVYPNPL